MVLNTETWVIWCYECKKEIYVDSHKKLYEAGIWMDPDMNKYHLSRRVTHHPKMTDEEWDWVYREFHRRYYTFEHMTTILRRMVALGSGRKIATINRLVAYRESVRVEGMSMVESGYIRIRRRRQRRSGMKIESPLVFYPWHWWLRLRSSAVQLTTFARLRLIMRGIERDPNRFAYTDAAIAAPTGDIAHEDLITSTRVTDYARKRMANAARAKAGAATTEA